MVPAMFVLEVCVIVVVALLLAEETLPGVGVGKGVKGPLDGLFCCCKRE